MDSLDMDSVFEDFAAVYVVNRLCAGHHIPRDRETGIAKSLLVIKALTVVTHENCKIFPLQVITFAKQLDGFDNFLHFFDRVFAYPNFGFTVFLENRRAARAVHVARTQDFPQVDRLVFKNAVRKMQDVCDRAIIPFQTDKRTFLEVIAETVDIPDVRPAEPVNGLVVIAHDKQRFAFTEQCLDEPVLRRVNVLIFIDENFCPLFLEKGSSVFVIFKQVNRLVDKVFKDDLSRFQDSLTQWLKFFEKLR